MNSIRCLHGSAALAFAALMASTVFAQTETPGGARPSRPPVPDARLAVIDGFEDDDAYLRSIAKQVLRLVELAQRTEDPLARANLLLAAANLILAHQLEPACTRTLLGIARERNTTTEEAKLKVALDRADELIADANATLEAVQVKKGPSADRYKESKHRLSMLQAFGHALRAYLLPADSGDAQRTARRAASRLSALLEERDPQVAAAARLWHASLRSRESDPAPAMSVLDLALADPPQQGLRYAFFARLLRCRLIAGRGGFATALALLTQVEKRCDEWFASETDRGDALRAITLVEIQTLADWHEQLSPSTHTAERQWCVERINALTDERFTEKARTVLRLSLAIPMIAHPPEPGSAQKSGPPDR